MDSYNEFGIGSKDKAYTGTVVYLPSSSMMVTCVAEGDPMVTTGLLSSCTLPTMGGSHVMLSSGCLKQRGVI